MFATANRAMGGSRTADNLADIKDNGQLMGFIASLMAGNYKGAAQQLGHHAVNLTTGQSDATRRILASMLMSQDIGAALDPAQQKAMASLLESMGASGIRAAGRIATDQGR